MVPEYWPVTRTGLPVSLDRSRVRLSRVVWGKGGLTRMNWLPILVIVPKRVILGAGVVTGSEGLRAVGEQAPRKSELPKTVREMRIFLLVICLM